MIQLFKPYVTEEAIEAVSKVLRSGWIGLGPKTTEFETRFAEFVGARYAVAVNSATSALHMAMIVSDVQPGDEVLAPSLTFVSTNLAILYQQAKPVFVDVDGLTLNLDLEQAETMISPRTRAIVMVHYGGNPAHMERLYAFAARHGLAVIEDASHACGASFQGQRIGSFGLTCFSFQAVKNLPTGDGGMLTTNDQAVYERLQRLRWVGIDRSTFARNVGEYQWEYDVSEVGYKYHMNDIIAAIGLEHLKHVDEWNDRRRQIVKMYQRGLSDLRAYGLRFVETTHGAISSHHLCAIRVPHRDQVVEGLKARDIGVGVHYRPNHHYAPFQRARRGDLTQTECAYSELVSLPLHLYLTDEDVATVCQALREVVIGLQDQSATTG